MSDDVPPLRDSNDSYHVALLVQSREPLRSVEVSNRVLVAIDEKNSADDAVAIPRTKGPYAPRLIGWDLFPLSVQWHDGLCLAHEGSETRLRRGRISESAPMKPPMTDGVDSESLTHPGNLKSDIARTMYPRRINCR